MSEKILSIIVPSYNMEKYLPKCLDSLVVSSDLMERLEVLVVNDGSKDRTSEIAHNFESRYPRTFKVIDKANGNYGSCINAALPMATGIYVKVLDADDTYDTDALQEYLPFLLSVTKEDASDLVINDFEFVDGNGVAYDWRKYPFAANKGFSIADFDFSCREKWLWMHAIAYRTELLRKIEYRQSEGLSYTDQEWISIPMSAVSRTCYFPRVLYRYFMGREGSTCVSDVYDKNLWMQMEFVPRIAEYYRSHWHELGEANRRYYITYMRGREQIIYRTCLKLDYPGNRNSLRLFDERLKRIDAAVYAFADEFVLKTRFFSFHYVTEWRRGKSFKTMKYFLYGSYVRLAMLLHRVVKRGRNERCDNG